MHKVKKERVNVTVACNKCKIARKKCSDNHNSSCERCVKKGLKCEYAHPVKKRGPRQIHSNELNEINELDEDDDKIDNNILRDDDVSNLSRKYGLHPNAVKDLKETYPNKPFDLIMTVLTATTNKKCFNEDNHICHEGCIIVPAD
ncbi:hypothetical protein Glove_384g33 [Diversispora epigaea]|uniref:Zn(2)-C6 fungal-type domain-containing protein n=1 Tax=Diversispora epigaea TaxID=1348612 RepID=A0A397H3Z9_9GLOM|nr:hypothetical protein Glove_384g33 [Diversispora epigaea]